MGALEDMLSRQWQLQNVMSPDRRHASTDPQTRCEYIKDMAYALEDEIHELTAETGWKPWTTSWHVNVDAARAEWIDAWHFMMNLANNLGMNEAMILGMYSAKAEINEKRMEAKYDGVSTKCPVCRRALDDPATECAPAIGKPRLGYCVNIGHYSPTADFLQ